MIAESVKISETEVRKLLGAASPDAALLYIYMQSGNDLRNAGESLRMSDSRMSCASATLRQLGLWPEDRPSHIAPGECPSYSEKDVLTALEEDVNFYGLREEVGKLLGHNLNTEDTKILLGFVRYLGLSTDVITVLVHYCKNRASQRGNKRAVGLHTIEKEAYAWAEQGIDTMEEAAAFIQAQNLRNSRLGKIMEILQIHGRRLTAAEEKYAHSWIDIGMDEPLIAMAYERTCLNTGGLSWAYMNKILQRWHEQGFHTVEAVQSGDRKADHKTERRQLDEDEQAAIRRLMQEG